VHAEFEEKLEGTRSVLDPVWPPGVHGGEVKALQRLGHGREIVRVLGVSEGVTSFDDALRGVSESVKQASTLEVHLGANEQLVLVIGPGLTKEFLGAVQPSVTLCELAATLL
jgi:hypothetical protein